MDVLKDQPTNLDHVDQTDDVGVIDPPQDINLRHETLLQLLVKPSHSDLLDCDVGPVNTVPRFGDYRERTRPDLPTNQVVADNAPAPRRGLGHFFYYDGAENLERIVNGEFSGWN